MSPALTRRCIRLVFWGLTLTGTLSIANWPGNWGHGVCGVWGCGPPLQALVACHLSWLVVLLPVLIGVRAYASAQTARRVAASGIIVALLGALGFVLHEYWTWYVPASEWLRSFFWRRVGFVILTTVEVPLLEFAGLSAILLLVAPTRLSRRMGDNRYRGSLTEPADGGVGDVTASSDSISVSERVYPDNA